LNLFALIATMLERAEPGMNEVAPALVPATI
jgi:hypothetical protein